MSDVPPPPPGAPEPPPSVGDCPRCGAPVRAGQDWCLNCGMAVTTEVEGAAGWRTPVAIVTAVLLVAAAALVLAFVELSGEADQAAQGPAATPVAGATPTPVATTPGPSGPTGPTGPGATGPTGPAASVTPAPSSTPEKAVGSWPKGKTAFTVILFSETSKASAKSKAKSVMNLPGVGILRSGDYSSLRSGYFVVFSDQYDSLKAAQGAAASAQSQAPGAYAKEVVPK